MAAALSLLAVIGGAAYGVLSRGSIGTPDHVSSGPPRQDSHRPAAESHKGDLRSYLVDASSGSQPWPHPLGTHRKLSLRQVANLSTDSNDRTATLLDDGFTRGAVQCWITRTGSWVDVRLYQFSSPANAQTFFRTDVAGSARTTPAADQSTVTGVPGARVFASAKPDHAGYVSVLVIGVKGDVTFVVDFAEHVATAHLALPDSLMQAEYAKL